MDEIDRAREALKLHFESATNDDFERRAVAASDGELRDLDLEADSLLEAPDLPSLLA